MFKGLVALTLFVPRILANNAHNSLPADDPAGFTELFDGRTNFHGMEGGENLARSHRLRKGLHTVSREETKNTPAATQGGGKGGVP